MIKLNTSIEAAQSRLNGLRSPRRRGDSERLMNAQAKGVEDWRQRSSRRSRGPANFNQESIGITLQRDASATQCEMFNTVLQRKKETEPGDCSRTTSEIP